MTSKEKQKELRIQAYAKRFEEMSHEERMTRLGELNKQMLSCGEKRGILKENENGNNPEFNREVLMNAGKLGIMGVILGMSSVVNGDMTTQLCMGALMGTMTGGIGIGASFTELNIKYYLNNKKILRILEECKGYARAFSNNPEKYYGDFGINADKQNCSSEEMEM